LKSSRSPDESGRNGQLFEEYGTPWGSFNAVGYSITMALQPVAVARLI